MTSRNPHTIPPRATTPTVATPWAITAGWLRPSLDDKRRVWLRLVVNRRSTRFERLSTRNANRTAQTTISSATRNNEGTSNDRSPSTNQAVTGSASNGAFLRSCTLKAAVVIPPSRVATTGTSRTTPTARVAVRTRDRFEPSNDSWTTLGSGPI